MTDFLQQVEEPKGIEFFNIKSGDKHYAKLEPTISAYINSSDMGINASRDQDFGWRLGVEWVKRVREFRRDRTQMQILTAASGGQKPTTVQILYYLYGEEIRAYQEELEEHEKPFEQEYLDNIASREEAIQTEMASEGESGDISDLIDDAMVDEGEGDKPTEPEKTKGTKQK